MLLGLMLLLKYCVNLRGWKTAQIKDWYQCCRCLYESNEVKDYYCKKNVIICTKIDVSIIVISLLCYQKFGEYNIRNDFSLSGGYLKIGIQTNF